MQALGLIEVVGYPPAVEAADAALKAANVTLLSIAKADAGIMTVEIVGDVGAVTSAVDAGARSAARIGLVRARHVIPRVEPELIGTVIPREHAYKKVEPKIPEPKSDDQTESTKEVKEAENLPDEAGKTQDKKPDVPVTDKKDEKSPTFDFSQEQLSKRSNANLRNLIQSLGIEVGADRLNTMKKQDLIRLLLDYDKKHEK
ncbi:BMC domain-containing protein [Anaerosporobacter sp.]